jgi:hypothetical protein
LHGYTQATKGADYSRQCRANRHMKTNC